MTLSNAEWRLMRAVWARGSATAREVHDEVAALTGWAYTTVKTMLARLVEKGALAESKRGHVSVYTPRVSERAARRAALHGLLERAFDGTFGSLAQFLADDADLSDADRATLARMLAEADTETDAAADAAADTERDA